MATHMTQFTYSTASVKGMVTKPQDRRTAAERLFAAAGGTLTDMYFCFGEYDGVVLADFPSNVDAASALMAAGSSGAFSQLHTTVLLNVNESIEAMEKAQKVLAEYTPPAG